MSGDTWSLVIAEHSDSVLCRIWKRCACDAMIYNGSLPFFELAVENISSMQYDLNFL